MPRRDTTIHTKNPKPNRTTALPFSRVSKMYATRSWCIKLSVSSRRKGETLASSRIVDRRSSSGRRG